MKILFIVPYAPNLIRVRPYQLIRTLAKQEHQLTVLTFWHQEEELSELDRLRALGVEVILHRIPLLRSAWNCLQAVPSQIPLQSVYCWSPLGIRSLQQLIRSRSFDVVHVEHLRGARYGIELKKYLSQLNKSLPVVWDSVDCISHLFAQASASSRSLKGRLMTSLELGRTQQYEGWLVNQFDHTVVTSKVDAEMLGNLAIKSWADRNHQNGTNHRQNPEKCVEVVPNGVDLDYFGFSDTPRATETIVFTGKMSYHANITAAKALIQEIMPIVWAQKPNTQVQIVGKDPPTEIVALANKDSQNSAHSSLPNRIEITGTVPDMNTYLQQATISVVPIQYGAGIQNKILEAMACGAPVVSSRQAAAGLNEQSQSAMVIADNHQTFAQALLDLLENPEHRKRLSKAGRQYVEDHYAWSVAGQRLESIYTTSIQNAQRQSY
ncbi:MAG: glycosyltransferase [Chloroflexota bacterium]